MTGEWMSFVPPLDLHEFLLTRIAQVIGASQKGLSTPAGLSVTIVSQVALKRLDERKSLVSSYFASYKRWLPIMQAYESGNAAYFATPPVVRFALVPTTNDY